MSKTNNVRLIGRFGQNPKAHTTESGTLIASFSFATSERHKDTNGNQVESTDWHNCVAFGKVAQLISTYMAKGAQAAIDGRIKTRQYTDKDSNTRYATEIIIEEILFLAKSPEADPTPQ